MGTPKVRDRLQRTLGESLKARDMVAVSALRSALGAIDNASTVPAGLVFAASASSSHIAGAVAGLGAADNERRRLSDDEANAIVRAEIAERLAAALNYEQAGHEGRQAGSGTRRTSSRPRWPRSRSPRSRGPRSRATTDRAETAGAARHCHPQ